MTTPLRRAELANLEKVQGGIMEDVTIVDLEHVDGNEWIEEVFEELPEGYTQQSTNAGTFIYDEKGQTVYDPNLA